MRNILRILILGDPANDSNLITSTLDQSDLTFQQLNVTALSDFDFSLKSFAPDVVLAFCGDKNSIGHQALLLLQRTGYQLPFICISRPEFEEEALKMLSGGAADYLLEDRLRRLPGAILQAVAGPASTDQPKNFALLQEIPLAIAILMGKQHTFTFVNTFFQNIIGNKPIINESLKTIYEGTALAFLNEKATLVYETGTTYTVKEISTTLSNGPYFNFSIQALRDATGMIEGLLLSGLEVTEQVQYRKEKEQVSNEIEKLLDAVNEGFYLKDIRNNRYLKLSAGCSRIYGYNLEEFHENPNLWYDVIHPEDRHIAERDGVLLEKGEQTNSQYRIIGKDKSIRWIEIKAVPHFLNDEIETVDGVISDITQWKETEEQIKQAEAVLSEAQKMAQMGNWNFDLLKQELTWSDGLKEIYWADETLIPENEYFDSLIHPDDKLRVEYEVDKLIRLGKNMKTSFRIRNTEGEVKILQGENRIEFDKEGITTRLYGTLQDVTSIKAAEDTLKKSEANLRTLLDHTDAAYILVDQQLNIISYSQMAKEIAEFRGHYKELEGNSIFDYFAKNKRARLQKIIDDVINGKNMSYETNVIEKDGSEKWFALKWIGVNDNENQYWGFILSMKDITEQKNIAKAQNETTSELIRRNKDLEQFTYVVSHNLRAPVANIMGISDLLSEMESDPSSAAELMLGLRTSIKNLDTVIKDLNYVLTVKKDAPDRMKELVEIQILVAEIKDSINNLIVSENMTFEYQLEEEKFYTVRGYLYSIFYNLILNSIKYRKPDIYPRMIIKTYLTGKHLNIVFEDNGKGIDLKKHGSQLFGLYKRFDVAVEGKGMGLFMVKTQVEDLGGTIQVTSEPGKGSIFHILLPINDPPTALTLR
ncbi:PAS domain-containing protein [Pedobacter sp. PLR]|uniref:PAS domain-containing sensor histidine kinase n=1 Tax=Pedobacter sp. PLR TaxID=2994465 RepID=UPI00224620C4|nr:PAS domain-containing protein [Pedobacter sp. PLR]MCX2453924.1 PAS domain-containing protein [Pedobacter sp. PLR]